jgi:hypothetical protein
MRYLVPKTRYQLRYFWRMRRDPWSVRDDD